MRALRPAEARLGLWTLVALRRLRRRLAAGADVHVTTVTPAPPARSLTLAEARRTADAVLTRGQATCLERAVVQQRLEAVWGVERDVVIGVRGGSAAFEAHAWLDGDADAGYAELTRRSASASATRPTA